MHSNIETCLSFFTLVLSKYFVRADFISTSVPPSTPRILGDRGKQLSNSLPVGPFKEGDPLTIQCVATGGEAQILERTVSCVIMCHHLTCLAGEPPPSVLWYRDNAIIDKTYIANEKGAVQNTLTIQRLDRGDMGPRYRCVASNTNMSLAQETWITLDIMCE